MALEVIVRAHSTAQQIALRAQIILLADDGIVVRESMRQLGIVETISPASVGRFLTRGRPQTASELILAEPQA